jgi:hypothetical protein
MSMPMESHPCKKISQKLVYIKFPEGLQNLIEEKLVRSDRDAKVEQSLVSNLRSSNTTILMSSRYNLTLHYSYCFCFDKYITL